MPTAPLFYQPLVLARVQATPIGDTNVQASFIKQQTLLGEAYENPKFKPAIDGIVAGFTKLQAELPGSRELERPQFAFDDAGYVANRVMTTISLHPKLFDTASPDQAAEIGLKLVEEGGKELADKPGMRAAGNVLEIAPDVTRLFQQHWEGGGPLDPGDVAYVGVTAARELQRSVTPLEPDTEHPQLQWIEDATAWKLGMWPGAVSRTVEALGLKADAAEVEKIVGVWRDDMASVEPKVVQPLKSLTAILGAAGITGSDDAAGAAAFQVLQGTPLDGVPAGIAQGIVAANELPADKAEYLASRIVETTGSGGNIAGLLAEIELMKRPPVVEPPGGPVVPSPGSGTPPAGPPSPELPPGGTPPPPVDPPSPPVDPDAPKPPVDPDAPKPPVDPDAPKPPVDPDAPKPPVDPDAPKPPVDPDAPPVGPPAPTDVELAQGEPMLTTARAAGSTTPMSPEQFEELLASVRAELDAEQGAHPVDQQPAAAAPGHGHAH